MTQFEEKKNALKLEVLYFFSEMILFIRKNASREEAESKEAHRKNKLLQQMKLLPRVNVVEGSMHEGSEVFSDSSRGHHCTCMALQAAVTAYVKQPSTWTRKDIKCILMGGDALYRNTGTTKSYKYDGPHVSCNLSAKLLWHLWS